MQVTELVTMKIPSTGETFSTEVTASDRNNILIAVASLFPRCPVISVFPVAPTIDPDRWIPACGGTEQPFNTRTGRRLLYCWNPGTGQHAYLDVQTDIILTNDEANAALGNH